MNLKIPEMPSPVPPNGRASVDDFHHPHLFNHVRQKNHSNLTTPDIEEDRKLIAVDAQQQQCEEEDVQRQQQHQQEQQQREQEAGEDETNRLILTRDQFYKASFAVTGGTVVKAI